MKPTNVRSTSCGLITELLASAVLFILFASSTNALAAGSLSVGNSYPVGTAPKSIVAGDFNGDGKLDVAVANNGSANISILLGNGDGTFRASVNYPVPIGPSIIATADFNNDGRLDLAVASGSVVSILLGNGDGTFQSARSSTVGNSIAGMALGDFNGDRLIDVAVGTSAGLGILLGWGNGNLRSMSIVYPQWTGVLAAADFNRDGKLDLAANLSWPGFSGLGILANNGDATFQLVFTYFPNYQSYPASYLLTAEFNNDGIPDIFAILRTPVGFNQVDARPLLGNGDGTFWAGRGGLFTALNAEGAGDFDGDGRVDVVVLRGSSYQPCIIVLHNNGGGSFSAIQTLALPAGGSALAVGDFRRDGSPDVVITNSLTNTVTVLLNKP